MRKATRRHQCNELLLSTVDQSGHPPIATLSTDKCSIVTGN